LSAAGLVRGRDNSTTRTKALLIDSHRTLIGSAAAPYDFD
jgi:hypothetical protein